MIKSDIEHAFIRLAEINEEIAAAKDKKRQILALIDALLMEQDKQNMRKSKHFSEPGTFINLRKNAKGRVVG